MEVIAVLMVLGLAGIAMVGWVLGLVAFTRTKRLEERLDAVARDLEAYRRRPAEPARSGVVAQPPPVEPVHAAPIRPAAPPPARPAPAEPVRPAAVPPRMPRSADPLFPRPPRPPEPPETTALSEDFATNIGPRILVATGALAFMVFLGLFAKYAWDSNWVGPAGRILIGAVAGIGLLALGIRLMGREYRPLGQGLAAAGLAGLYTSAFAAHGLYDLVPREVSALLMIGVTVSAVLLALRLDARLLAMLAWTGGYMTPLLLSTGEDRALALFLFLGLLDAGALFIDRKKPWPETAPLAMTGTVLLYGGWYERFFRPERFEVAAAGLVLLTALFAIGMARKQRAAALGIVIALAGIGIAVMAGDADRPVPLLILSMALAAFALRASADLGRGLATVALVAAGLPLLVWWASHYDADSFGIAALWVLLAALLFIVPAFRAAAAASSAAPGIELTVLALAGIASAALCATTDRPLQVGAFLAAMAGLAVLVRGRWREAELLGILSTALSVALWMQRFFGPARAGDAYVIALPSVAVFGLALLVRGLIARQPLASADVVAHLAFGGLTWWFLYAVLDATHPALEGPVAAGMAAAYLVIGLAALRHSPRDQRLVQVTLGLASAFLTLAIPIQLGLHGVTLAWAAEGVLLLALGARFASAPGRAAGYAVLALAAAHVVGANQPLHVGSFRPVFNPVFGTWLAVVAAFGAALWVTRAYRAARHPLDSMAGPAAGAIAILLLFGVLNAETRATFAQRQLEAERLGDMAGSQAARRISGLAISVLWTIFATGLLAAGLAARSRALFYAAYALFAITAGKVVVSDLEDFSVPYRMFAFLALGLLLMAGAYLNLRFRERLLPAETS